MNCIGIFGGAFDPIHFGHLRTAFELSRELQLEELRFIPCGDPPHRQAPIASTEVRLRMIAAAIDGEASFATDDRETTRSGPSYSIDTLESLHSEFPDRSLCLILGMDAFLGLPDWHRWPDIPKQAHIIVAHRPGWQAPADGPLGALVDARRTGDAGDLHKSGSGRVYVHEVTQLEIASSAVRRLVAGGGDPRYLLPRQVAAVIADSGCYANPQTGMAKRHA